MTVLLVVFMVSWARAQYCTQRLRHAQQLYQEGRIDSVLITLDSCLNNPKLIRKLRVEDKASLFKMVGNTHIILDQPGEAQPYIQDFLSLQPFYRDNPDPDDLIRFSEAIDSLQVFPKWKVGFRAGLNLTTIDPKKRFDILDFGTEPVDKEYVENIFRLNDLEFVQLSEIMGFNLGLILERSLWSKNTSVSFQPGFSKVKFKYQIIYQDLGDLTFEATQKISYFDLPIIAKYRFMVSKKVSPFVLAGIYSRVLLNSNKEMSSAFQPDPSNPTLITRETPETPVSSLMNDFSGGFIVGAGVSWNWRKNDIDFFKRSSLNFEIRYLNSWNNANDADNRFMNNNLSDVFLYEFYDVMDDIRLNNLEFSVSLLYDLNYNVFQR